MPADSIRRLLGAWPQTTMTPPFIWLFGSSGVLLSLDDKHAPLDVSRSPLVQHESAGPALGPKARDTKPTTPLNRQVEALAQGQD